MRREFGPDEVRGVLFGVEREREIGGLEAVDKLVSSESSIGRVAVNVLIRRVVVLAMDSPASIIRSMRMPHRPRTSVKRSPSRGGNRLIARTSRRDTRWSQVSCGTEAELPPGRPGHSLGAMRDRKVTLEREALTL